MDMLFDDLSRSIDFLVLGTVAILALCLPFGFNEPLRAGWKWLTSLVHERHTYIQVGLIAGVLFAAFYFSGYFLNAAGHTVLHRAHFLVIRTVAKTNLAATDDPGMPFDFLLRTVPLAGRSFSSTLPDEVKSYWDDATRQFYWEVCDKQSSDDMLGGNELSELRLLRGTVGLTWILLPVCAIAFAIGVLPCCKKYRFVEKQWLWSGGTLVVVGFLYAFLIIPSYWDVEYEEHSTIWAAFPARVEMDIKKIDEMLPCLKMKIIAEGKKANETPPQSTVPPKE